MAVGPSSVSDQRRALRRKSHWSLLLVAVVAGWLGRSESMVVNWFICRLLKFFAIDEVPESHDLWRQLPTALYC